VWDCGVGKQHETKFTRVAAEPAEGRGVGEALLHVGVGRVADVDGAAGVVFAEAGCGDVAENVGERAAGRELAADECRLRGGDCETLTAVLR